MVLGPAEELQSSCTLSSPGKRGQHHYSTGDCLRLKGVGGLAVSGVFAIRHTELRRDLGEALRTRQGLQTLYGRGKGWQRKKRLVRKGTKYHIEEPGLKEEADFGNSSYADTQRTLHTSEEAPPVSSEPPDNVLAITALLKQRSEIIQCKPVRTERQSNIRISASGTFVCILDVWRKYRVLPGEADIKTLRAAQLGTHGVDGNVLDINSDTATK
ncbi:hypothetical protein NDU88_004850 [Pleurodeles waltl]|uniref:Uncharacterized protein n=1 Tax=Pleurodeles waltl TaxID=8319 RepID=A0AAV7QGP6_PLEWA|nr:hypothetical protein NDU88_004850 [Pleurodeles waltl]